MLVFGELPHLRTYSVTIVFREAPGVTDGTPIRMNGVLIGRVSGRPVLLPDGGVEVTAHIDADRTSIPKISAKSAMPLWATPRSSSFNRRKSTISPWAAGPASWAKRPPSRCK